MQTDLLVRRGQGVVGHGSGSFDEAVGEEEMDSWSRRG